MKIAGIIGSPPDRKIDAIFAVCGIAADGQEGIMAITRMLPSGPTMMPLVGSSPDAFAAVLKDAAQIAKAQNLRLAIYRFDNKTDVTDQYPIAPPIKLATDRAVELSDSNPEDIPQLVHDFAAYYCGRHGTNVRTLGTAYLIYVQLAEGLSLPDDASPDADARPRADDRAWFAQRRKSAGPERPTKLRNWIAMARHYRHKSSGFAIKGVGEWEEVQVSRQIEHPEFGRCLIGSHVCGPGMFNVHFPADFIRPATEDERAKLCSGRYGGVRDFKLSPEEFADQATLDALPIVPWESL